MVLAAVVCTTGCLSSGNTSNLKSSDGGLAANGPSPGPSTPGSTVANGWTTSWKNNPVTNWLSKEKAPKESFQSTSRQQPVPSQLDPISLEFASGPPSAKLYVSMANISDQGGNTDQARLLYQKASSLESDYLPALLGLARLEDRHGRLDDAIPVYQKAITAHPQNTAALNDLAICYARKSQLETSLDLLKQAVRLQPDKPLYRNNIAKVLTELGRQEEALVHLAVVHSPAIAHYNLGVLLAQRGRMEESTRYLAMAADIDPEMQSARALLDQLNLATRVQLAERPVAARQPIRTTNMRAAPPRTSQTMGAEGSNNNILPTRYPPTQETVPENLPAYPATGIPPTISVSPPEPQTLPATISELPVGDTPLLLPPVN
jgi:tetratricopeptide (TPR) repeat protein